MSVLANARNAAFNNLQAAHKPVDAIYVYALDISDARNIYKVGRTADVWRREKDYSTITPEGRMVYYKSCENSRDVEKVILQMLQQEFRMKGEVVYGAPLDVLKALITNVADRPNPRLLLEAPEKRSKIIQNSASLLVSPYFK